MANLSDLEEAFDEALDAAEEAKGEREKITLRGQEIDAIVHEAEIDPDFVGSGVTKSAPWRVDVRKREVILPFRALEPISIRGMELQILSFKPLAGRVSILAGDPAEEVET